MARNMTKRNWRKLYNAALTELNPAEQRRKIDVANGAIHERLYELANEQVDGEEQRAIVNALQMMRGMQGRNPTVPSDAVAASYPIAKEGAA